MPRNAMHMPTEIINLIFSVFSTVLSTSERSKFPWFLGHICSNWRSIFLSMTEDFWSWITIPSGSHDVDLVKFFLQRAAPFSFIFECYPTFFDISPDVLPSVLEILIEESMRWKDVRFMVGGMIAFPLKRTKYRLALLERIDLQWDGDGVPELYDVFQTAPSLTTLYTVSLQGWMGHNYKSLTDLSVSDGSLVLVTVLPEMTGLQRLTIECPSSSPIELSKAVCHPRLTALCCHRSWLSMLETPALDDLTLYSADKAEPDFSVVLSFVKRSSCSVLRFTIVGAEAAIVVDHIRLMPSIVHLQLSHSVKLDAFISHLAHTLAQERLVRHLTSLSIHESPWTLSNESPLLVPLESLISSRTGGKAKMADCKMLQWLTVIYEDSEFPTFQAVAELCKRHGVQYNRLFLERRGKRSGG